MALNGVSMPLAFVGQEWVMYNFLQSTGVADADILGWMSGPAFLPW
jgi:alpha-N-acetylglucosaminidase